MNKYLRARNAHSHGTNYMDTAVRPQSTDSHGNIMNGGILRYQYRISPQTYYDITSG